jgi:gamma-glutamyl-gamma-aminobutyrate hydrolase PuuD
MRLIYVENDYDGRYGEFWAHLGEVIRDRSVFLARPQDFDLICFTGGEDVSPELYNHRNLNSHNSRRRDAREMEVHQIASELDMPMTGICRGSQFLNVMSGGTMVQDLRASHGGSPHLALTCHAEDDVKDMKVTSSHHQMSLLGEGGEMLAHSEISIPWSACVYDGEGMPMQGIAIDGETWCGDDRPPGPRIHMTEAFAYPERRIFAVQHHPEWQNVEEEAPQWTLQMIRKYCFQEEEATQTA